MTFRILLASIFLLATSACSSTPAPAEPTAGEPTTGEPTSETPAPATPAEGGDCSAHAANSPEHCECLGGYVKGDIGDGKVACTDGDTELERTNQGIEGAVCCKKAAP